MPITQSFFDEGRIAGAVEILRGAEKKSDEEILETIKEHFQLNDYEARTFVYPKDSASA